MKIPVSSKEKKNAGKDEEREASEDTVKKTEAEAGESAAAPEKDSRESREEKGKELTGSERIKALEAELAEVKKKAEEDRKTIDELGSQLAAWQDKAAAINSYAVEMKGAFERCKEESAQDVARAKEKVLSGLLPTLDDFDRALATADGDADKDYEKFVEGIRMVSDRMFQHLSVEYGLQKMKSDGEKFDPSRHQALQAVKDKKYTEDTVVATLSAGYLLGGKVLRPAKVIVGQHAD